jgi:hypothetical protein
MTVLSADTGLNNGRIGESARRAPASCVAALTGNAELFYRQCWGREPRVFRCSDELRDLVSEAEFWDLVDSGQLPPAYVRGFKEGTPVTLVDFTSRRFVCGQIGEYVDAARVRTAFEDGATLQFNELQHWHRGIAAVVSQLEQEFKGGVTARAFLSPPSQEPVIKAHLDGAHVFVLQLMGDKDWVAGHLNDASVSDCKFCDGDDLPSDDALMTTLRPGEVLYLPHGSPHYALARRRKSVHLSLEIHEAGPQDFADVYIAQFVASQRFRELATDWNHPPVDKMARLGRLLADHLDVADPARVVDAATRLRRRHMGG